MKESKLKKDLRMTFEKPPPRNTFTLEGKWIDEDTLEKMQEVAYLLGIRNIKEIWRLKVIIVSFAKAYHQKDD